MSTNLCELGQANYVSSTGMRTKERVDGFVIWTPTNLEWPDPTLEIVLETNGYLDGKSVYIAEFV